MASPLKEVDIETKSQEDAVREYVRRLERR